MPTVSNAEQDAKTLARRVDRTYIYRQDKFRLARRITIILCVAGALVAFGAYARKGDGLPYSPGPVTSVHALWNADCSWCHEPKKEGGFDTGVSDAACLRCHDATIHNHNQIRFTAAEQPGARPGTAVGEPGHGPTRVISADCKSCHLEHRGRDLMIGRIDAKCTQCHANIAPETASGNPHVQPVTTAFAPGGAHPEFGRNLTPERRGSPSAPDRLRDPTPLNYNHKAHRERDAMRTPPLSGEMDNCTSCHRPSMADGGKSIAPVSYDRDCKSCHQLTLPAFDSPVPHGQMEPVRAAIRTAILEKADDFRQQLARMSPADREKALTPGAGPRPPGTFRPGGATAPKGPPMTPEQWLDKQLNVVRSGLLTQYTSMVDMPGFEPIKAIVQPDGGELDTSKGLPKGLIDPRVIEYFVVHRPPGQKSTRCDLCHETSDNPAAVKRLKEYAGLIAPPMSKPGPVHAQPTPPLTPHDIEMFASLVQRLDAAPPATAPAGSATQPATQPAAAPMPDPVTGAIPRPPPVETLPTGFADGPRRWFTNSKFDHRAHRATSCIDCHGDARTSEKSSDVLLPTMTMAKAATAPGTPAGSGPQMLVTCVQCHAPQPKAGSLAGGAGTACLDCHDYHQRPMERSSDGWIHHDALLNGEPPKVPTPAPAAAPTSQPAAPPPVAVGT